MQLFHQEVRLAPCDNDIGCNCLRVLAEPGANIRVRIRGRVVQIERKRAYLSAIVRIASHIGYAPPGKRSQAYRYYTYS